MTCFVLVAALHAQDTAAAKRNALNARFAAELETRYSHSLSPYASTLWQRVSGEPSPVQLLRSDERFALALPSRGVFLTTAFAAALRSEAELAGVLAHLAAHQLDKDNTSQPQPLIVFAPGGCARWGSNIPIAYRQQAREKEKAADQAAWSKLNELGYDAALYSDFLARSGVNTVLARAISSDDRVVSTSDFEQFRREVSGTLARRTAPSLYRQR
jgi:hypothetical protein